MTTSRTNQVANVNVARPTISSTRPTRREGFGEEPAGGSKLSEEVPLPGIESY